MNSIVSISMKKVYCILLLLTSVLVAAQTPEMPSIIPPSPTVAALMKFEEVPVSHYTGVPGVSIPLFTTGIHRELGINIQLSYHSGNVNANAVASETGLGWSLEAGGSISRTVRGVPDEIFSVNKHIGIYHDSNSSVINKYYNMVGMLEGNTFYNAGNRYTTGEYMWDAAVLGKMDTEHDLYQYNFLGYSGRFMIKKQPNGLLVVEKLDKNPLKITNNYNATTYVPNSFIILDDKGYKYEFSIKETSATSSFRNAEPFSGPTVSSGSSGYSYISAFHLSKIYDPNDLLLVEFNYTDDNRQEIVSTSTQTIANDKLLQVTFYNDIFSGGPGMNEYNPLPKRLTQTSTQTITVRKLLNIDVKHICKINFGYTQGRPDSNIHNASAAYKLSSLEVKYHNDTQLFKKYNFSYIASNKLETRMLLDKIEVLDKQQAVENSYRFWYNNSTYAINNLSKDYWGYLTERPYYDAGGYYREPSAAHCANDVLEIIKYPNGGMTYMAYESNTYSYIGDEALSNFDENPENWNFHQEYKSFTTRTNNTTLFFEIAERQEVHFMTNNDFMASGINDWMFRIYKVDANNNDQQVAALWNIEKRKDTLEAGRYRVAFYTPQIVPDNTYNASISVFYKIRKLGTWLEPAQRNYLLGGGIRIKSIAYYDTCNILNPHQTLTTTPSKKNDYSYQFFNDSTRSSGSLVFPKPVFGYSKDKRECVVIKSGMGLPLQWHDFDIAYDMFTVTNLLASVKTKGADVSYKNVTITETGNGKKELVYSSAIDFPEDINAFNTSYPFLPTKNADFKRGNLLSEKIYDSSNKVLEETTHTYDLTDTWDVTYGLRFFNTADYAFINYHKIETFQTFDNYLKHCIQSDQFETPCTSSPFSTIDGPDCDCFCFYPHPWLMMSPAYLKETVGWPKLTNSNIKKYQYNGALLQGELQQLITYTYKNRNQKIATQLTTNSKGETALLENYYSFDLTGDPNMMALSNKNSIAAPVRQVFSNSSTQVSATQTVYKDWGGGVYLPELVQTSKGTGALETRVQYNLYDSRSNVLEVQQPDGTKVSYIWGYHHAQPVAKLENIAYSSIPAHLITAIQNATDALTYNEATVITALNNLRADASVAQAMITTLTHIPLVGVSTVTDPKGDTATYHYDAFNRLKEVRDKDNAIINEHTYHYRP